jgi:predicted metal-dependent HD superfamily phosphohydrolase
MKFRWMKFWKAAGASGDPDTIWKSLSTRYREPHRAYHTLTHIAHCLDELDGARKQARDPVSVEMAIWYHDAVYDPRSKDNEARSADLAARDGEAMGQAKDRRDRVTALILASINHDLEPDPDVRLFSDIDLAILGRPPAAFAAYEKRVRIEYSWVPEPVFRAGRSKILKSFLERASIYGTAHFRRKYETAARRNLERSLGKLGG